MNYVEKHIASGGHWVRLTAIDDETGHHITGATCNQCDWSISGPIGDTSVYREALRHEANGGKRS